MGGLKVQPTSEVDLRCQPRLQGVIPRGLRLASQAFLPAIPRVEPSVQ